MTTTSSTMTSCIVHAYHLRYSVAAFRSNADNAPRFNCNLYDIRIWPHLFFPLNCLRVLVSHALNMFSALIKQLFFSKFRHQAQNLMKKMTRYR